MVSQMKRITVYIAENQHEWLQKRSEQLGVTAAEVLRQAIEHYINVQRHPYQGWLTKIVDPGFDPRNDPERRAYEEALEAIGRKPQASLERLDERMNSIELLLRKLIEEKETERTK